MARARSASRESTGDTVKGTRGFDMSATRAERWLRHTWWHRRLAVVGATLLVVSACGSSADEVGPPDALAPPGSQSTAFSGSSVVPSSSPANETSTSPHSQASDPVAEATVDPPNGTTPQSAPSECARNLLLAATSDLFPNNPRWRVLNVDVVACGAGYAEVITINDQSQCPSSTPCLENERVFLKFTEGAWTYLDSGSAISCSDPSSLTEEVADACKALDLP